MGHKLFSSEPQIARGHCQPGQAVGLCEIDNRRLQAGEANWQFLERLYRYGAKYGLPNIAPEHCALRLREEAQ